ncbi:MAG: hypothetical protein AAB728_02535, partial [Patescibacteria group bacterium]
MDKPFVRRLFGGKRLPAEPRRVVPLWFEWNEVWAVCKIRSMIAGKPFVQLMGLNDGWEVAAAAGKPFSG